MRRIAISLAAAALLASAASPAAAQGAPGASAHAAAGGVTAPEPAGSGATGGASYGTVQQLDAERMSARRAAARRAAAKRRAAARRRAAAQRTAARKRAKRRATARARRQAARRRAARTPAPAPVAAPAPTSDHVFPVAGPFSLGGSGSRFGAGRPGHIHQGQDISAASGTPLVAPSAGTVRFVKFQAGGAGHYVVIAGEGENRDYVFMHLLRGSIVVEPGDRVAKGEQFAAVGNSGSSSGPHLHFEIWVGGWYVKGGRPVDPLPILRSWL